MVNEEVLNRAQYSLATSGLSWFIKLLLRNVHSVIFGDLLLEFELSYAVLLAFKSM